MRRREFIPAAAAGALLAPVAAPAAAPLAATLRPYLGKYDLPALAPALYGRFGPAR